MKKSKSINWKRYIWWILIAAAFIFFILGKLDIFYLGSYLEKLGIMPVIEFIDCIMDL